jgi:hypothetical protein
MGSLSGTVQGNLLTTLRYLDLISDDQTPTAKLSRLTSESEKERHEVAMEILDAAYPFVFRGNFELASATTKHLTDQFANAGATGDSLRKCMKFFVSFAEYAGMTVSQYVKTGAKRGPKPGSTSAKAKKTANKPDSGIPPAAPPDQTMSAWHTALLAKFPELNPDWPDDVKAKWFEAFQVLMEKGGSG